MVVLYAVRLTCSVTALQGDEEEDCTQSFLQYLLERFDQVIVYEHIGTVNENVHCHLLLRGENTAPTADAIRKSGPFKKLNLGSREHSFKSSFKDKQTKTLYAMTDEHVPKYITYMTKGVLEPVYHSSDLWDYKSCITTYLEAWKAPPVSKTAKKVAEFAKYLGDEQPPIPMQPTIPYSPYTWLKNKVWSYIMNKYDGFDYQASAEFKMLLVTFMWKRGYSQDEKSKSYI